MGKVCVTEEYLQDIADAIREKGVEGTFTPAQMGDAVRLISGGGNIASGTFVSSDTQYGIVDIDCGFEPDMVIVTLPFNNGDTTSYWWREASWGAEKAIWELRPAEQNTYVNNLNRSSGETGIQAINSNGFSFMSNGENTRSVTCKYFACKYI